MGAGRPVLFMRARTPSVAGYSYDNSFDVGIRLNTDPNRTNPVRTHDRAPNPNRPSSHKNFWWVELVTWGKTVLFQPERALPTELSQHSVRSAAKWVYKRHVIILYRSCDMISSRMNGKSRRTDPYE